MENGHFTGCYTKFRHLDKMKVSPSSVLFYFFIREMSSSSMKQIIQRIHFILQLIGLKCCK